MTLWLVRAGRAGEREQFALDNSMVVIGWDSMPDMSDLTSKEAMAEVYQKHHPDSKPKTTSNQVGQLMYFAHLMQPGDMVVIPLKTSAALAAGTVIGQYEYSPSGPPGAYHRRKVRWLRTDIPRAAVDQDLLFSFGAFLTVCKVSRHDAEVRMRSLVSGKALPTSVSTADSALDGNDEPTAESPDTIDIETVAHDRIVARIQSKFAGHGLSALINSMLQADGYVTKLSPPGADGGVDILAGSGPMGFDLPRIAVQVKSGDTPIDVTVFRTLQGSMQSFKAEQGLLVSWGGFTPAVKKESAAHHFHIRMWDSGEVLNNLLRVYDRLDSEIRAELPLKRLWTLADEDE